MSDIPIKIQRATLKDIGAFAHLIKDYLAFYRRDRDINEITAFISKRLENNESVVFAAFNKDKSTQAIGFTHLYPIFSTLSLKKVWVLNDLYVNEHYRGMKIGRLLIDAAASFAKEDGAFRLDLKTEYENTPAKKLYEKYGFVRDETYEHFSLELKNI